MTVMCWCCGRPTEAAPLTVELPTALLETLLRAQAERGTTASAIIQEALSLLLLPPPKAAEE